MRSQSEIRFSAFLPCFRQRFGMEEKHPIQAYPFIIHETLDPSGNISTRGLTQGISFKPVFVENRTALVTAARSGAFGLSKAAKTGPHRICPGVLGPSGFDVIVLSHHFLFGVIDGI